MLSTGVVLQSFGVDSTVCASYLDADGQIVMAGGVENFAAFRYSANGIADPSFGGDGAVITPVRYYSQANSVAPSGGNKIVVAGRVLDRYFTYSDFGLVRYNHDGTLDTSFSRDGIVQTDLGGTESASDFVVMDDGSIIAAGYSDRTGIRRATLVRYTPSGEIDTLFGEGGIVQTALGVGADHIRHVTMHQGKILAVGYTNNSSIGTGMDFALARYELNGALDQSFGAGGIVSVDLGSQVGSISDDNAYALAIDASGKILVAGGIYQPGRTYASDFAIARLNPTGFLDEDFGSGGFVLADFGDNDEVKAIAVQADGKIVATGYTDFPVEAPDARIFKFAVARYTSTGTLDTSFGTGGKIITPIPGSSEGRSVVIQPDQRIVVSGVARNSGSNYLAMARYNTNGTLDTSFGEASLPAISIANFGRFEGKSGTTAFDVTVSLSNLYGSDVTVHYATEDGTAKASDNDYVTQSGTLRIPAGQASATITILVNGDTRKEPDEFFYVNLTNPVNATIATSQGTGVIRNDDKGGTTATSTSLEIQAADQLFSELGRKSQKCSQDDAALDLVEIDLLYLA